MIAVVAALAEDPVGRAAAGDGVAAAAVTSGAPLAGTSSQLAARTPSELASTSTGASRIGRALSPASRSLPTTPSGPPSPRMSVGAVRLTPAPERSAVTSASVRRGRRVEPPTTTSSPVVAVGAVPSPGPPSTTSSSWPPRTTSSPLGAEDPVAVEAAVQLVVGQRRCPATARRVPAVPSLGENASPSGRHRRRRRPRRCSKVRSSESSSAWTAAGTSAGVGPGHGGVGHRLHDAGGDQARVLGREHVVAHGRRAARPARPWPRRRRCRR